MARKVSELVVKLTDQVTGPAGRMQAALKKAQSDLGKVQGYKDQKAALDRMAAAHEKARESVRQLGAALMAADSPSKKMQAAYERATQAADKLGNKLQWQQARVRGAEGALNAMGISVNKLVAGENALRAATDKATAAIARQQVRAARVQRLKEAAGTGAAIAGVAVGYRARQFGRDAVNRAATFDTSLRHQRFATDVSELDQRRVLVPQAERIGQDTKFTNEDVVRAQTEFANGLPAALKQADVLKPIIDQAKNYALTLKNVDMTQGAMAVRGYLLSLGKDISSPEKAEKESRSASNKLIRASKIGGLEHEDLMHLIQRGGSAARLAGLSDETILALGVGMKRSNISGDMAGTALRTLSSKLVAPGPKQLAALTSSNMNFSDYVTMPGGGLSVDAYEKSLKQNFGKSLTPRVRKRLETVFGDEDTISNPEDFTKAVVEAVGPLFGRNKKGDIVGRKAIAKKAAEFHKFGVESVDSERLLTDLLSRDPSLGILNAFATDKHGNKLGLVAKAFEQFLKDKADLKSVSPDYGDKAAALLQGGLEGAINQLTGGIETLKQRLGSENEYWLTPLINRLAGGIDGLTDIVKSKPTLSAGLAAGAGAASFIGGSFKLINDLLGGNAPAIALTGSAVALGNSAAALTLAAGRLGVAGAIPAGATAAGATGAAAAGGSRLAKLGRFGLMGAGAFLTYEGVKAIGDGNAELYKGVQPGDVHNEGRKRLRRAAEMRHAETQRIRESLYGVTASEAGITGTVSSGRSAFGLGAISGKPSVDLKELEAAKSKAAEAKTGIEGLDLTVSPKVDTASLREALSYAQALSRELQKVGPATSAAASRGSSEVQRATAALSRSRQTNMQDRDLA